MKHQRKLQRREEKRDPSRTLDSGEPEWGAESASNFEIVSGGMMTDADSVTSERDLQ